MDINKIKEIVNSPLLPEIHKEKAILSVLAADKKVIPYIMEILDYERQKNIKIIADFNVELSRALVALDDENVKSNKKAILDPKWVAGEVRKHYLKWQEFIKCAFVVKGLP